MTAAQPDLSGTDDAGPRTTLAWRRSTLSLVGCGLLAIRADLVSHRAVPALISLATAIETTAAVALSAAIVVPGGADGRRCGMSHRHLAMTTAAVLTAILAAAAALV